MMDTPAPDFTHKVYKTPLMQRMSQVAKELGRPGLALDRQPALYKVADFILQNPWLSPTLNIEHLSAGAGTSTAAVNRLANYMGMNGFTGLREALVLHLLELVSPADWVRAQVAQHPERGFGLHQQVRLSTGNLDAALSANDDDRFDSVVTSLAQARHLYVLGFGNCHYLAGLATTCLVPHCAHVVALNMEGGSENAAYRMAAIGPGDTLLTLALQPYANDTLHLAEYAASRGAAVVAITDSPASPMMAVANQCLFAPPTHPVLRNSKVAMLVLIEALASAVRLRNLEPINQSIRLAEDALKYVQGKGCA